MPDVGGMLGLAISALLNGSAFVPVKLAGKRAPNYDHAVFQGWWGLAAGITMVIAAPFNCFIDNLCFKFSLFGFVAGACIFTATMAVLVAVHHLGVGLEPAVVAACFVVFSLVEGLLFLGDSAEPLVGCGLVLLAAGAVGLVACHQLSPPGKAVPLLPAEDSKATPPTKVSLGVVAALTTGLFGSLVPFTAKKALDLHGSSMSPFAFTPSTGIGLIVVTTVITPLRVLIASPSKRNADGKRFVTNADDRESSRNLKDVRDSFVALYAIASGVIWGGGNVLINFGLTQGVEFATASAIYQCALLVGGLWGIAFGEIHGWKAIACFAVSALALLAGIVLLAKYVHPGDD